LAVQEKILSKTKSIAFIGLFIALILGLGYSLIMVPNVEMIIAMIFISGVLMGKLKGAIIGLIGEFLFSALNPFGSGLMFPPLIVLQSVSGAIIGFTGGLLSKRVLKGDYKKISIIIGLIGLLLTLFYDVATTIAYPITAGFDAKGIIAVIIAGVGFSIIHIVSNTIIFALIVPYISRILYRAIFINYSEN